MNVISFSLWGDKEKYLVGAIENLKLAKDIYPGWQCRFYVDDTVSSSITGSIKTLGGEIEGVDDIPSNFGGMFWRFFVNDDPKVERYIIRDCDSRLNFREKACVDEWVVSDKRLHTIHDHFLHIGCPILGGMWGAKKGLIEDMEGMVRQWIKLFGCYHKGCDQEFLKNIIWPWVKQDCLRHDNGYQPQYGVSNKIPNHKPMLFDGSFIGEVFDEYNKPEKVEANSNQKMLW